MQPVDTEQPQLRVINLPRQREMMVRPATIDWGQGYRQIEAHWFVTGNDGEYRHKTGGSLHDGYWLHFIVDRRFLLIGQAPDGSGTTLDQRQIDALLMYINRDWLAKQSPDKFRMENQTIQFASGPNGELVIIGQINVIPHVDKVEDVRPQVEGGDTFSQEHQDGLRAFEDGVARGVARGQTGLADGLVLLAREVQGQSQTFQTTIGHILVMITDLQREIETQQDTHIEELRVLSDLVDKLGQDRETRGLPDTEFQISLLEAKLEALHDLGQQVELQRDAKGPQSSSWNELDILYKEIQQKGLAIYQQIQDLKST